MCVKKKKDKNYLFSFFFFFFHRVTWSILSCFMATMETSIFTLVQSNILYLLPILQCLWVLIFSVSSLSSERKYASIPVFSLLTINLLDGGLNPLESVSSNQQQQSFFFFSNIFEHYFTSIFFTQKTFFNFSVFLAASVTLGDTKNYSNDKVNFFLINSLLRPVSVRVLSFTIDVNRRITEKILDQWRDSCFE